MIEKYSSNLEKRVIDMILTLKCHIIANFTTTYILINLFYMYLSTITLHFYISLKNFPIQSNFFFFFFNFKQK